jgi:hypothetical protein
MGFAQKTAVSATSAPKPARRDGNGVMFLARRPLKHWGLRAI